MSSYNELLEQFSFDDDIEDTTAVEAETPSFGFADEDEVSPEKPFSPIQPEDVKEKTFADKFSQAMEESHKMVGKAAERVEEEEIRKEEKKSRFGKEFDALKNIAGKTASGIKKLITREVPGAIKSWERGESLEDADEIENLAIKNRNNEWPGDEVLSLVPLAKKLVDAGIVDRSATPKFTDYSDFSKLPKDAEETFNKFKSNLIKEGVDIIDERSKDALQRFLDMSDDDKRFLVDFGKAASLRGEYDKPLSELLPETKIAGVDLGIPSPEKQIKETEQSLEKAMKNEGSLLGWFDAHTSLSSAMDDIERSIGRASSSGDYETANKLIEAKELIKDKRSERFQGEEGAKRIAGAVAEMVPYMAKRMAAANIATTAAGGNPLAGMGASAKMSADQGAGSLYTELKKEGLSDEKAAEYAATGGALYGAVEAVQVGQYSKLLKGISGSARKTGESAIKKALVDWLINSATTTAAEVTEEGMQEAVLSAAKEFAKDEDINIDDVKEIGSDVFTSIKESLAPIGIFTFLSGGIGGGKTLIEERAAERREKTEQAELDAVGEVEPNEFTLEFTKRVPEATKKLLEKQVNRIPRVFDRSIKAMTEADKSRDLSRALGVTKGEGVINKELLSKLESYGGKIITDGEDVTQLFKTYVEAPVEAAERISRDREADDPARSGVVSMTEELKIGPDESGEKLRVKIDATHGGSLKKLLSKELSNLKAIDLAPATLKDKLFETFEKIKPFVSEESVVTIEKTLPTGEEANRYDARNFAKVVEDGLLTTKDLDDNTLQRVYTAQTGLEELAAEAGGELQTRSLREGGEQKFFIDEVLNELEIRDRQPDLFGMESKKEKRDRKLEREIKQFEKKGQKYNDEYDKKPIKINTLRGLLDKLFLTGNATPETVIKKVTGKDDSAMKEVLYDGADRGKSEELYMNHKIVDELKNATKDLGIDLKSITPLMGGKPDKYSVRVTLPAVSDLPGRESSQELPISKAQAMEIYLHNKSESGRKALRNPYNGSDKNPKGGILLDTRRDGKPVSLTDSDIDNIIGTLSENEISFADALFELENGILKEYGNKASKENTGVNRLVSDNYHRQNRKMVVNGREFDLASELRKQGIENVGRIANAMNFDEDLDLLRLSKDQKAKVDEVSRLKQRTENDAPLIIDDALSSFATTAKQIIRYGAYAKYLKRANSLMSEVKGSMEEKNLKPEYEALKDFVNSYEEMPTPKGVEGGVIKRLENNLVKSYFGLNPFIAAKQHLSLPFASSYVDQWMSKEPGYEKRGIVDITTDLLGEHTKRATEWATNKEGVKQRFEDMKEYSPQLFNRVKAGLYSNELSTNPSRAEVLQLFGESDQNLWDKVQEKNLSMIHGSDAAVVSTLWEYAKEQTGGDLVKTADMAEYLVRKSQPTFDNKDISTNKRWARKTNNPLIDKLLMFSSVPNKGYQMLFDIKESARKGDISSADAAAQTAFIIANLAATPVLVDWLRDRGEGKERTPDFYAQKVVSNAGGVVPLGSDAVDGMTKVLAATTETDLGSPYGGETFVPMFVEATSDLADKISMGIQRSQVETPQGETVTDWDALIPLLYELVEKGSAVSAGVPMGNIRKLLTTAEAQTDIKGAINRPDLGIEERAEILTTPTEAEDASKVLKKYFINPDRAIKRRVATAGAGEGKKRKGLLTAKQFKEFKKEVLYSFSEQWKDPNVQQELETYIENNDGTKNRLTKEFILNMINDLTRDPSIIGRVVEDVDEQERMINLK